MREGVSRRRWIPLTSTDHKFGILISLVIAFGIPSCTCGPHDDAAMTLKWFVKYMLQVTR